MVKVVFKRSNYDGLCEKCRHFQKKLDNPLRYPSTIMILCSLNHRSFQRVCPLMYDIEVGLD
jgi:hypothetical protein